MQNKAIERVISTGWHWNYGWLRVPEKDEEYGFAYEQPCGEIVYSSYPFHRNRCKLECREIVETGEQYICLSFNRETETES